MTRSSHQNKYWDKNIKYRYSDTTRHKTPDNYQLLCVWFPWLIDFILHICTPRWRSSLKSLSCPTNILQLQNPNNHNILHTIPPLFLEDVFNTQVHSTPTYLTCFKVWDKDDTNATDILWVNSFKNDHVGDRSRTDLQMKGSEWGKYCRLLSELTRFDIGYIYSYMLFILLVT
jgi:hypothetical protein